MENKPTKQFRNRIVDDVRVEIGTAKQKTSCYYCNESCMNNNPVKSGRKTKYLCDHCFEEQENGK